MGTVQFVSYRPSEAGVFAWMLFKLDASVRFHAV